MPESIGQMVMLRQLNISRNQLTELPESIGQLIKLERLFLTHNKLKRLPESLSQLLQLRDLIIQGNELMVLPESIGQMAQLKTLYIRGSKLIKIPDSIGDLTKLKRLSFSDNQLTELPGSLGNLVNLKYLNLSNNRLTELPASLTNLKLLNALFLHGNSVLSLPAEVLGPTWQAVNRRSDNPAIPAEILDYYFRLRSGSRPLNEAKLILVGRGAVGKSSLVNRFVYNYFEKDLKKTDGIRIIDWNINLYTKEHIRLNVWDFGGQEIMHATHQFFLTRRSLYLLVLNGRGDDEDADAEYWLRIIESFAGDSPVIIVMNKIKEHNFDLNRRALQRKYPTLRDFIKTDCEDGTGIDELCKAIELETHRLEHLRDAFPVSWFTIKNQLAGMKKNYLSFDEYREICAQHGEINAGAQEVLARYLHNLGIALNYKDDPRLQDTHVLNPHWVTGGIYKILNSDKLERQRGEIHLKDLSEILDEARYPRSMHRFIFDLMKKFELCFSFPEDDTHFLIPELLDKQEPAEAADFKHEECLNFQYDYPLLPAGVLPRFIVRTQVLSKGLPRWRTGVILKFEDNKALVKADIQDNKVVILVSGIGSGRRRLLAVIRSDFERIHRDIRNLQPQGMVPLPSYPNVAVPCEKLLAMEREGVKRFWEFVNDRVIGLSVEELLDGVDIKGAHRGEGLKSTGAKVFVSYSHRDESLRNELETHLKILQREGLIKVWQDRKIGAGDEWKTKINENLERADIILLLVSADFIASDYCYEIEMKRALERHEKKEARVIPIIVRDVNWRIAPFAKLQALPNSGQAVTLWQNKDSAWRDVANGIEKAVRDIPKGSFESW